jgi:ABC-type Mn2+/Zn2+ transport system ATPase subunit
MPGEDELLSIANLVVGVGPAPLRKSISFSVGPGQICGIFGNRGAGKRLLLEASLGISPSLKGKRLFLGQPIDGKSSAQLRQLGIASSLFSQPFRYRLLDALQEPTFEKRIRRNARETHNCTGLALEKLVDDALYVFGIENCRTRTLRNCSAGTGYRCLLAEMWVRKPRLIVLSDPFSSFDSSTMGQFIELLQRVAFEHGVGILFTSRHFGMEYLVHQSYRLDDSGFHMFSANRMEASNANSPAESSPNLNHDIFISYSRRDSATAISVRDNLVRQGVSVWIDQRNIDPGIHWDKEIEDALLKARLIIVLLSPDSCSSANVMDEVSFAMSRRIALLPVLIKQCDLPLRLHRLQYVNALESSEDVGNLVSRSVTEHFRSL